MYSMFQKNMADVQHQFKGKERISFRLRLSFASHARVSCRFADHPLAWNQTICALQCSGSCPFTQYQQFLAKKRGKQTVLNIGNQLDTLLLLVLVLLKLRKDIYFTVIRFMEFCLHNMCRSSPLSKSIQSDSCRLTYCTRSTRKLSFCFPINPNGL